MRGTQPLGLSHHFASRIHDITRTDATYLAQLRVVSFEVPHLLSVMRADSFRFGNLASLRGDKKNGMETQTLHFGKGWM